MKNLHLVPFEDSPEYYYLMQGDRSLCVLTPSAIGQIIRDNGPKEQADYAAITIDKFYSGLSESRNHD